MTRARELYLPRVQYVYPDLFGVIAAFGCRIVLAKPYPDVAEVGGVEYGEGPIGIQAYTSGEIYVPLYYLDEDGLSTETIAWCAHEAAHLYAGDWSLDDEIGLLAFEVEVYRRVADDHHRAWALEIVARTQVNEASLRKPRRPYDDILGVVQGSRRAWTSTPQWRFARQQARRHGLDLKGRINPWRAEARLRGLREAVS